MSPVPRGCTEQALCHQRGPAQRPQSTEVALQRPKLCSSLVTAVGEGTIQLWAQRAALSHCTEFRKRRPPPRIRTIQVCPEDRLTLPPASLPDESDRLRPAVPVSWYDRRRRRHSGRRAPCSNEAARVHQRCSAARQRGRSRRTRSSRDAALGVLDSGSADKNEQYLAPFWQGLSEAGYVEGQNVAANIDGRTVARSFAGIGGRSRSPSSERDRGAEQYSCSARGQSCDLDDPNRLWRWRRSGQARSGREPRPTGRQRDRHQFFHRRVSGKEARTSA